MTMGPQPGAEYFEVMVDRASTHWWYAARRALFAELLADRVRPGATALDIGCGTGETMSLLRDLGASTVAGTDIAAPALARAATVAGCALAAQAEHLPFGDAVADLLVSSDVLEHLDDDRVALDEYHRVLRPGGVLLVTVPSYAWLWCPLDVRAGHRRRYRLAQLVAAVTGSGFRIERSSYYFSFLVPPAAAIRRTPLGRLTPATDEEASDGRLASAVLTRLCAAERRLLRRVDVPFGLSQLVVARRP